MFSHIWYYCQFSSLLSALVLLPFEFEIIVFVAWKAIKNLFWECKTKTKNVFVLLFLLIWDSRRILWENRKNIASRWNENEKWEPGEWYFFDFPIEFAWNSIFLVVRIVTRIKRSLYVCTYLLFFVLVLPSQKKADWWHYKSKKIIRTPSRTG